MRREMTEEQEDELRRLLESWGLKYLLEPLASQNVFVDVLKVMQRHHIQTVLKSFSNGVQIMFEHNLETWRLQLGSPLPKYYGDVPSPLTSSPREVSPSTSRESTPHRFEPYVAQQNIQEKSHIPLIDILNDSSKGCMLLEYYNMNMQFQDEQRTALINLIAQAYEEKPRKMTLSESYILEKEIQETFPTEKSEFYRTGKRGRIYNRYINTTSSFRAIVHKNKNKTLSNSSINKCRPAKIFQPEEDAESYVRALQFDRLTDEEFDSTWKACSQYRLNDLKNLGTTTAVIDKWPFYKTPTGFRLIDMDFDVAFGNGDGLLSNWPKHFEKILNFLFSARNIREPKLKAMVEQIKTTKDLDENSRNGGIFLALHGYFVPTSKVVQKDSNGRNRTTKFTIKDSQDSFLFVSQSLEEFEDYLNQLKNKKSTIQPFVFIIGENIFHIEEIYLYFDNIRFKFFNLLHAIDTCFKTIYLFNLDFPVESIMFYTFLESCFFKFKPNQKFSKVSILIDELEKK